MGEKIELEFPGHRIGAWLARPAQTPRAGLVLIQEIFGLNAHIRSVAERLATHGFQVVAPALFDAVEAGVELDYDPHGYARGRELATALGFERALAGVEAATGLLRRELGAGAGVAATGYCWGGSVAFLANTRLGLPAVSYYGARTVPFLHERLRAPMLFHFGQRDPWISAADIEATRKAQPDAQVHVWPAGHGFNCEMREDYDADCAATALEVTLAFLAEATAT